MIYIIVDLDGTLCDDRHRHEHAEQKDWDSYHSALEHDHPHPAIMSLIRAWQHRNGVERGIIILTSRPETYRLETCDWLDKYGIAPEILMTPRSAKDRRPSVEVKEAAVRELLARGHEIIFALEDRPDLTEMFVRLGIPVLRPFFPEER